jgi:general secretion pathway protein B
MSLILDAINRAQRERANPGEVPGIATQHYVEATAAPGAWRQGLLGLGLVVALAFIAWLWLGPERDRDGGSKDAAPRSAAGAVRAEDQAAAPRPALTAEGTGAKTGADRGEKTGTKKGGKAGGDAGRPAAASARAPLSQAAMPSAAAEQLPGQEPLPAPAERAQPPAPGAAPGAGAREPPESASPTPSAEVAALYARSRQTGTATSSAGAVNRGGRANAQAAPAEDGGSEQAASAGERSAEEAQSLDVEALLQQARSQLVNQRLEEHPAPFLADLAQQRKDAIPTLLYSAHDYRGGDGQSSVQINGHTAHAGERLDKGVTVDEILPDSVVLSHEGQQFRLRALNSWVNL